MGEEQDSEDQILILGAGLAGLSAAYQLKKNRVPFRLFEASQRAGGRAWTVRDLNVSSRHGELGGERIEADHTALQQLAGELKIPLSEWNPREPFGWLEKGKLLTSKDWRKEAADLSRLFQQVSQEAYGGQPQFLSFQNRDQFPKAAILDRISAADLLDRLQIQLKPWMKPFLQQVIRQEWGVEPHRVSALHLVHWVRDSFKPSGKKFYKVRGGTSVLTRALWDRISGVIPERFVKFQHRLTEIREEEGVWFLFFQTPRGIFRARARQIICTLPVTLLRQVAGWEAIPMSAEKRILIQRMEMGTQASVLLGFQNRFWGESSLIANGGLLITDSPTVAISEAGNPVNSGLKSLHGVLKGQFAGEAGANAGPHTAQLMLKDLEKLDSRAPSLFENISYVQNWKTFPWSQGSKPFLKPGQYQSFDLTNHFGAWTLAGDAHSLPGLGTMNGAVRTGIEAADRFLKTRV